MWQLCHHRTARRFQADRPWTPRLPSCLHSAFSTLVVTSEGAHLCDVISKGSNTWIFSKEIALQLFFRSFTPKFHATVARWGMKKVLGFRLLVANRTAEKTSARVEVPKADHRPFKATNVDHLELLPPPHRPHHGQRSLDSLLLEILPNST
jgi:hypothetical protein